MTKYYDKNNVELVDGTYCYYSELPYSNYADSLKIISYSEAENKLMVVPIVINIYGKYKLVLGECESLPLDLYLNSSTENVICKELQVLPDDLKNISDYVEYMNKNFPLS